ncbi:MAG: endonuclease Q family protein [Candidatus Diapherotrites archaeon]|nr:endonuclease Q family protein [Candidatus Diapherotrites archaeon]
MREYNCDLHFHGLYSGGVSKNMLLPVIAEQSKLKGLDVCGTADITHAQWLEHVKESLVEEENGVFKDKKFDTHFIIQTEIQCKDLVHNIIFLPDLAAAETLREKLKSFGILDSWGCGRPRLRLTSKHLAEIVLDLGGMLGPAHAFTPYFSIYAHFKSMEDCFGELSKKICFMELGLSADSYFADLIKDNWNYTFLTNSDSHSPWPHRIGREFTRIKMQKPCYKELEKALRDKEEKLVTLNAGLDPREGKYHRTACNSCFTKFSIEDAQRLNWKCPKCNGTVKRGVRDLILGLAEWKEEAHPEHRPPYLHQLPLAEIIQIALGVKQVQAKQVQDVWRGFVDKFENEINALVDAKEDELLEHNKKVGEHIIAFRKGFVQYIPGGGGDYGKPVLCASKEECERIGKHIEKNLNTKEITRNQRTLEEF